MSDHQSTLFDTAPHPWELDATQEQLAASVVFAEPPHGPYDYAVPPALTREYLRLWPHARGEVLSRTGHLGVITRPEALARLIDGFLADLPPGRERRMIG